MSPRFMMLLALVMALAFLATPACRDDRRRSVRMATALARPASKEALIRRALRALQDNDPSAYVDILSTVSEVTRACPERFEDREPGKLRAKWQRMIARTRKSMKHCAKLIDWKKARQVSISGGKERGQLAKCEEKVIRFDDIIVVFSVGAKRFEVRLTKPYMRGDMLWGVSNGPRCRALGEEHRGR